MKNFWKKKFWKKFIEIFFLKNNKTRCYYHSRLRENGRPRKIKRKLSKERERRENVLGVIEALRGL